MKKSSLSVRRANACSLLFVFVLAIVPTFASPKLTAAAQVSSPDHPVLQPYIEAGKLDDLRWPNFSDYRNDVKNFYESSNYALAWLKDGRPTNQALAVITVLEQADQVGLSPEDYDGPRWKDRIAKLIADSPHAPEDELARFDLALTVSTMRYVMEVQFGRVKPTFGASGR